MNRILKNNFVISGFDVRKKERGHSPKQFENNELQARLDEDDGQIQQLTDQLNVDLSNVSRRLTDMGEIYRFGPTYFFCQNKRNDIHQ